MDITLCQINPIVGDFSYNKKLIINNYLNAIKDEADLVVFPELSICGYPPQDLLFNDDFINENNKILNSIAMIVTKPLIIGYVRIDGNNLYNSAALCLNGKVISSYDKINLPTYDIFDEKRYFTKGEKTGIWEISHKGVKNTFGIQICEDLWDDDYVNKVSKHQKSLGANFIINISASPFNRNKLKTRVDLITEKIKDIKIPFFYCNLVGGQDELIFDGNSIAFSKECYCIAKASSFKQDTLKVDFNSKKEVPVIHKNEQEQIYNALTLGLHDYMHKSNHKKAVIGLSGGIDSALVASIAVEALGPENVYGVSMPSKYSSNHSLVDAKTLSKNLKIQYMVKGIKSIVKSYNESLSSFTTISKSAPLIIPGPKSMKKRCLPIIPFR